MPQSNRICLSLEQRQRLAALAESDPGTANADLDRLETILNDHRFVTGVFETPKPNEVRELIAPRRGAGLIKQAQRLAQALNDVPWQVGEDFMAQGFDLPAFRGQLNRFLAGSQSVLAAHAGEKTARRERQSVRDRHTIPAIADLFDRLCGPEEDRASIWEHTDRQCAFVALALEYAGIPCPDAGDTQLGEVRQGRLRRILKAHAENKRRHRARNRSRRAMSPASPARTE